MYDIPPVGRDLFAAFVITKQGPALLDRLDPSKALVTTDLLIERVEWICHNYHTNTQDDSKLTKQT